MERETMSYLDDALKSDELFFSLETIASDDGKAIKDYTLREVLLEARYVLSCFYEGGHVNNEWLNSDDIEERKEALREVKALRSFINKYNEKG
jgi:hypothetical protein